VIWAFVLASPFKRPTWFHGRSLQRPWHAERDLPAVARALEILGLSLTPLSNTEATLGQRLVADWDADPNLFGSMRSSRARHPSSRDRTSTAKRATPGS
jgi:hypothetical protein